MVRYRDNTKEEVTVRAAKISELQQFWKVCKTESDLIEFACGRNSGWSDSLKLDSFDEVVTAASALNFEKPKQRSAKGSVYKQRPNVQTKSITLAMMCAEVAVILGCTPAVVSEMTLAQLTLIMRAYQRLERGRLSGQGVLTRQAIVTAFSKSGPKEMQRLLDTLTKEDE